jgi:hypothetical protein
VKERADVHMCPNRFAHCFLCVCMCAWRRTGREAVVELQLGDGRYLPPGTASDPQSHGIGAHHRRAQAPNPAIHVAVRVGRDRQRLRKGISFLHHDLSMRARQRERERQEHQRVRAPHRPTRTSTLAADHSDALVVHVCADGAVDAWRRVGRRGHVWAAHVPGGRCRGRQDKSPRPVHAQTLQSLHTWPGSMWRPRSTPG